MDRIWKPLEDVFIAMACWWKYLQDLDEDDEEDNTTSPGSPPEEVPPYEPGEYDTLADAFEPYIGVREYNGIVATIQTWYYGYVQQSSWCATSVSYFSHVLGILGQIGGKNANVNAMRRACIATHPERCIQDRSILAGSFRIERGDILFWLWDGTTMQDGSNKHVGVAFNPSEGAGSVECIGGNQSDMIKVATYDRSKLYMVFRPDYTGGA